MGGGGDHARAAQALVEETGLSDYATSAIVHVATARVALHEARVQDARAALTRAHRLRPQLDHGIPWLTIQVGLELTRAHLTLSEPAAARTVLTETERVLELRPDMGSLVGEARELRERVAATSGSAGAWAMSLTGAELRLLPYLATHLTFPEVAGRLFISRNTVKTEAVAIYRKLGVASRSEAIERAVEVGLLESSIYPPRRKSHPGWMTRRQRAAGDICAAPMDEYKQHLRRLAVHDDALFERIAVEGSSFATSVIDERTAALVRVAATVAVDAAPASFQHAVALALAAGASSDEIVAASRR